MLCSVFGRIINGMVLILHGLLKPLLGYIKSVGKRPGVNWLKGISRTANQGPLGQAHFVETAVDSESGGARKAIAEGPYINDWSVSSNGSWTNVIIESIFGVDASLNNGISAKPNFGKFDPKAELKNLSYQGKTARLEYWFMFSTDDFPFTDSLNQYKSVNGLGELSELAMPGYVRHPFFREFERGKKGDSSRLKEFHLPAGVLPYEHTVHIYLPQDYNEKIKYPVMYFQDGRDYIECAVTPHILDELIYADEIKPVIAVFVTPPNLHQTKIPNRMTEYGLNDDYVEFFTKELVHFVDSKYSTQQNPKGRLVIGDSFGGLISTYISFKHPEIFGMAYSQSGYFSFNEDKLIKQISSSDKKDIKLFADVGTYERNVGASFLPDQETDFLEANRRLNKILEEKEYDFVYEEYFEGHTWGNWRRHLIDVLIYFFGNEK
jgi:enterochelin esterase-like enzyme